MKIDMNGCSTTTKGEEQYETFKTPRGTMYQYDYYRTETGKLFSCVAPTLFACRQKRDKWLAEATQ